MSENIGVARTTVHRILRRELLHPFHIQRVQALLPEDYPKRVQFCREMLRRSRENPQYFNSILWTDEANFRRTGVFNIHNMHHWAVENPRIIRDHHFQHHFGVNLWAGIMNGAIIGPFELPARLRGPDYLNFLQNDLPNLLENLPLAIRAQMWFQHDGAPAHWARVVRQFLNAVFPERWIGRGGTIQWPPDLNPLDFFLWGYFKELVYSREHQNVIELRQTIQLMAERIRNDERALRRLKQNFIRRCRLCIRAGGRQFQHLM